MLEEHGIDLPSSVRFAGMENEIALPPETMNGNVEIGAAFFTAPLHAPRRVGRSEWRADRCCYDRAVLR